MKKAFAKISKICIALLLLESPVGLFSQNYQQRTTHLSQADGLPSSEVFDIVEDADGLMWFSLREGIARYDGYQFKIWNRKELGLPYGVYPKLFSDQNGGIWYYPKQPKETLLGLKILDARLETVLTFDEKFKGTAPFKEAEIELIQSSEQQGKTIFIITKNGEGFSYDGEFHKIFGRQDQMPLPQMFATARDGYWLADEARLLKIDKTEKVIYETKSEGSIQDICITSDGKSALINRWNFGSCLEPGVNSVTIADVGQPPRPFKFDAPKLKPGEFAESFDIGFSKNGAMFFFLDDFVSLIDSRGKILLEERISDEFKAPKSIVIRDIFVKSNQVIWLTTTDGIFKIALSPNEFRTWLPGYSCRGILKKGNQLFVNTYQGDRSIDLSTNQAGQGFTAYKSNFGIAEDEAGNVWIGKEGSTLVSISENELITQDFLLPGSVRGLFSLQLPFPDQKTGRIWVGMNFGLSYLEPGRKELALYPDTFRFSDLTQSNVRHFYRNHEGIWMATSKGLFLMNNDKKIVRQITEKDGLPDCFLNFIHEDGDGVFWLGSKESGLIRWDRKSNTFRAFTTEDGLSNNNIHCIYEDKNEQLWMTSNYGLMRFDKKTYSVNSFHQRDGLPSDEFNFMSHYRDEDGNLYLGGLNGVVSFHPKDFIFDKNYDQPLVVSNFRKLNSETGQWLDETSALLQSGSIVLQPHEYYAELRFALLDYADPGSTHYAWKIEGLNDDWSYQSSNLLVISRLPYGNYHLHIKAQGRNGQWSSSEIKLPLRVLTPFYLRWWFIVLGVAALTAVIFGWVKFRIWNLHREKALLEAEVARRTAIIEAKNTELEELNAAKDRLFAIIAHDLRSPALSFRGIAQKVNYLIKKGQFDLLEKLGSSIESNAQNLNYLLDNLLAWATGQSRLRPYQPDRWLFREIAEEVLALFETQAVSKGIHFKIEIPDGLEIYADRNSLEAILRNLLSNAVKFTGEGGQVSLSVQESPSAWSVSVRDSGVGISPEHMLKLFDLRTESARGTAGEKGSGLGLTLVKDLVEIHQGQFKLESLPGRGTTVIFTIPKILKETAAQVR